MYCMFCNREEKGNLDSDKDIICGLCVTTLLKYPQEELYSGYMFDKKIGFHNKASAIASFLEEETIINGSKTGELSDGGRSDRVHGNKKDIPTKGSKIQTRSSLYKSKPKLKDVLRTRRSKLVKGKT